MSRITTGWRLAKESWALLRADRSLAIFPALSTAFSALALALLLTPGLVGAAAADKDWVVLPFLVVGGYAATFFVVYFNVALAGAARLSMDGRDTTVADGLAVALTSLHLRRVGSRAVPFGSCGQRTSILIPMCCEETSRQRPARRCHDESSSQPEQAHSAARRACAPRGTLKRVSHAISSRNGWRRQMLTTHEPSLRPHPGL